MPWLQVTRFGLLLQCVETVGEDECEGLFSGHGVGGKKQTAIGWRVHFEFALGSVGFTLGLSCILPGNYWVFTRISLITSI